MSGRFDDLKRMILRKRDYPTKYKLIKLMRREIEKADRIIDFSKMVKSVEIGIRGEEVVAFIEAEYSVAVLIKNALKDNNIINHFDIQFKVDDTYPDEALKG